MHGQGIVSGSVSGGGLLRETVTDVPAAQDESQGNLQTSPQAYPQEK